MDTAASPNAATASACERPPSRVRSWLDAALVVPDAQVRWLDADYQLYTYELFHKHPANRWVHALGIPLGAAATAAWLVGTPAALPVGLALGALHLFLALRLRTPSLLAALAPLHAGIWLFGEHVIGPALAVVGLHPLFVVLGAAFAQYVAHLFEVMVPPPVAGSAHWQERGRFFAGLTVPHAIRLVLLAPFHILVELVSSPRNLFLLVLGGARGMGLLSTGVDGSFDRVRRAIAKDAPVLAADRYDEGL